VVNGVVLGPIIEGWLTTPYNWRYAFAGEVIIVIIVLWISYILQTIETGELPKILY
jgi:MFS family permease